MIRHQVGVDLGADLAWIAERIEGVLEQAGRRGMSPAAAARAVRRGGRAHCTTADARLALAHLAGLQLAHTGTRDHPGRYFAGRPC